jgi:hypothetical protein
MSLQLFIPSVQIYGFSDTIPFHLQLSGSVSSLRALAVPTSQQPVKSPTPSSASSSLTRSIPETVGMRVMLSREIYVEVRGHRTKRTCGLGEGTFRPLPPVASSLDSAHLGENEVMFLDWEGELHCTEDISCTGFYTDILVVKVIHFSPSLLFDYPIDPVVKITGLYCAVLDTSRSADLTIPHFSAHSPDQIGHGSLD